MDSIEELTVVGLGQRLKKVFQLSTQPVECSTSDRIHMSMQQQSLSGKTPSYPILAYSLATMSLSDVASPTAAMAMALRTSVRQDTIGSLSAIPATLQFGVTYLDNDRKRVIEFMSTWLRASAQGLLNFRLRVDDAPIDVQVNLERSIQSPVKDITPDTPNQYEMEGSLTVSTWISGPFEQAIKRITRIEEVTLGVVLPPADAMPEDMTGRINAYPNAEYKEDTYASFTQEDRDRNLVFEIKTRL